MNIKKIIASAVCTAMIPIALSGCTDSKNQAETEETAMQTTETTAEKEIPLASVNTAYKSVTVDGNTTNMDKGTVWRGLGVITGNNSSRLLMDYKTENPDAYWEIMNLLF